MNRKQRRNNKASTNHGGDSSFSITSADDIPLARPPDTRRTTRDGGSGAGASSGTARTKTLFEIAAERQAQLLGGQSGIENSKPIDPKNIVQVKIGQDGQIVRADGQPSTTSQPSSSLLTRFFGAPDDDDDSHTRSETPWFDTILLATSLSTVHFTLDVLTVHQYAQELLFRPIFARAVFTAFPTLAMVIALFRGLLFPSSLTQNTPPAVKRGISTLRQVACVLIANVAGCYLVALTNDKGYYAVMKDAPGVGTIWVWAVLELGLMGALAGVGGPAVYAWWNEYGIF
ncbi:hypothetical protein PV08_01997 [Exophiala spinifera]|uniref:DUF7719 domain-containing protein n=1 Tax=Exophiala spinifera TaxID=91928 RepID=A0A0D2A9H7_9EURO|nr:uncharacterized protein PV08_01997 [Exophiala spinifera]KIW21417.1 hypothetical protein PV08_01997 [Exophiala spinifera]